MANGTGNYTDSNYTGYVSTKPTIALTTPTGIAATPKNSTTVKVSWNAAANASGYTILYATDSAFTQNVKTQTVSSGSTTSADVTGLTAGTTYYFRVMATGTGIYANSTYTGWVTAKPA